MRYNTKCTVWHKQPDGAFITQHYPCWWQDTEAENIAKTGKTDVDRALIHLPLLAVVDKSDYIAKGDIDFETRDGKDKESSDVSEAWSAKRRPSTEVYRQRSITLL